MSLSLDEQIKAVEREIALRERVYPRLTARGSLKPEAAARQLEAMRAVRRTLERVRLQEAHEAASAPFDKGSGAPSNG